ncbi:hypothetical protein [Streptomyces anulatus]
MTAVACGEYQLPPGGGAPPLAVARRAGGQEVLAQQAFAEGGLA